MHLRLARRDDIPALTALIDASIRGIGSRRYDDRQIEASLREVFGVDTQMIDDGTYFVVEDGGRLVGAGGWSRRRTPFGGDQVAGVRDASLRDPCHDPAVIRAFYVHPEATRRGIGRMLVDASEAAAHAEGFQRFELVATLTGIPLYAAVGYHARDPVAIPLSNGATLDCVRMVKPDGDRG